MSTGVTPAHPSRRRRASQQPSEPDRAYRLITATAQVLLLGLVLVSPWFFGGVRANFQAPCFVVVLVCLACWLCTLTSKRSDVEVLPSALVPLLLALGLGGLQLIPVADSVARWLSPKELEFRQILSPKVESFEDPLIKIEDPSAKSNEIKPVATSAPSHPLTIYPAATRRDLALLALAVATFALGARFFRRQQPQLILFAAIAINGAALSFFGIAQKISWNGMIYWRFPLTDGGSPFGPFINRNNGAGYLNLCLAGAVGLLLWLLWRQYPAQRPSSSFEHAVPNTIAISAGSGSSWSTRLAQVIEFVGKLNAPMLSAILLIGSITAGITLSFSRGGFAAMVAGAVAAICATRVVGRRKFPWWALALSLVPAMGLILWLGMTDSVENRLESLLDRTTIAEDGRLLNWQESLRAVPDFWPLGSGLGTYGYVYQPYQRRSANAWHLHAENQYLEALVNGGVIGLGLLLAALLIVALSIYRLLRKNSEPSNLLLGTAATFALATQMLQGTVDFGLFLPANMLLLAVLCGAASGRAALLVQEPASTGHWLSLPQVRPLPPLVLILLLGAVGWGWREMRHAAAVEVPFRQTNFAETLTAVSDSQLIADIDRLGTAVIDRWDDAHGHFRMAQLWTHLYRLRAFTQFRQELGSKPTDVDLWNLTNIGQLHARASQLARAGNTVELDRLRNEPLVVNYLRPAWKHFVLSRAACPYIPDVHLQMAALCFLEGNPQDDRIYLDRVELLARLNLDLLFEIGALDLDAGRDESAYDHWRTCWSLDRLYQDRIPPLALTRLSFPEMLEKVAPLAPRGLIGYARDHYDRVMSNSQGPQIGDRLLVLASATPMTDAERSFARAWAYELKRQFRDAAGEFRRAVEANPTNLDWRFDFARSLERQGRFAEAFEQLQPCLKASPRDGNYVGMLDRIRKAIEPSRQSQSVPNP
jgi:O-antigen ligase